MGPANTARNRPSITCVQPCVAKKSAIALCLLLSAGCARTVEGTAVVEDPWHGLGVSPSATVDVSSDPDAFDPCTFDEITLSVATGVDPASRIQVPGGCSWSGDGVGFSAMLSPALPLGSLADMQRVSDLTQIVVGDRTVHVFVFEGDTCTALTDIGAQTLQMILLDDRFSRSCIGLRVAVRMLLDDA